MHQFKKRHLQFLAIGGAIGAGYFVGSGTGIKMAGPSLLLVYAVAGIMVFFIMRALGELTVTHPESGSFGRYAIQFIGPATGFITGWSYWLSAILACAAESTGIGLLIHHRFPTVPQWSAALVVVLMLTSINLCGVTALGESEFWLSIVKVATVAAVVCYGMAVLIFHVGPLAPEAHLSNLWRYGGFMPTGLKGLMMALPIVIFAFGGIEIIGLASVETERPEVTVPSAINSVLYRILLFYVGSFATIMALLPWTRFSDQASPFVVVLSQAKLPAAQDLVTLVTILAIFSSGNTVLFGSTRMLYGLASAGQAPVAIATLNSRHVPYRAVLLSAAILLATVGISYLVPDKAFNYVLSMAAWLLLWTWASIMLSHLGYRRALKHNRGQHTSFGLPGAPFTNWLVLALIAVVSIIMTFGSETRYTFMVLATWLALLLGMYHLQGGRPSGNKPVPQNEEYEMHV